MKSAFTAAFIILMRLLVFGGQGNDNNFRQEAANRAREAKARSVDQLLIDMERDWARAILAADAGKIRQILAPEVVLTTPDGTVLSREDDLAELARGEFKADVFDPGDMKAKVYGNCAVVTGWTRVIGRYKGKKLQDQFRWTDTMKRNGKWRIVASQATAMAKPL
jgi:ketosteroid isomerase-like protein